MRKVDTSLIVRLCLPQFAVGLFTTMLNNYLIYFYQPSKASGIPDLIPQGRLVLGVLTIIGMIKAVGHIIDAVTDPLIAAGSDKSRHKDGRRIPLMKKAAIPFGLCALLIFFVPLNRVSGLNAAWIAAFMWGYYFFFTLYMIPVMRMAAFIAEADEKKPYIRRLHPEVRGMFEAMAPHMKFPMGFVFSHLSLFERPLIKLIPKLNAAAGEMLGTGCTFRRLSTDEDGSCRCEAFLRCINDADLAKDLDALRDMAAKHDVELTLRDEDNEYYRPASLTSSGYRYIKKTVEATFPYAAAVPFILPAGTDARQFTGLSDAVIRFAPIDIDKQQYASVHGENENISVDKLHLEVDFYKALLRNYLADIR